MTGPKPAARVVSVETAVGRAEVTVTRPPGTPRAVAVLGHGAGGGLAAPDLVAVRAALLDAGLAVCGVVQPYRVAGRRAPAPAAQLDVAWCEVVRAIRRRRGLARLPLVVGGRSSGARVACRTAAELGACAVVALAFPLEPPARPGRPRRSRLPELAGAGVPTLVVQGERDPFGGPQAFPAGSWELLGVPLADHALRRGTAVFAAQVAAWVDARLEGQPHGSTAITASGNP